VSKIDSLKIPDAELGSLRPWSPNSLARRGPGAERRAANQPGGRPMSAEETDLARAREQAVRQGYAEGRALAAQQAARLQSIAAGLQSAAGELERDFAEELMALALELARHILRTEITASHEPLLATVREVLAAAPETLGGRELLLHPEDVALVNDQLGGEPHLGAWRIIPDASVSRGGCRLIAKSRDVDATLATRWQRAMQRLGRSDPLEPGS
jgi:flagellar assembly protein FliH